MGGNLFKMGRINKESYFDILQSIKPVLNKHFNDKYRIPLSYRNKKDYGDVDIIVDSAILINKPNWKKELISDLGVTQTHTVRNVYSMLYKNFQTDIFLVATNKLETCNNFMSYNILGNLIGRIYHKFNLKYGENGLNYVLRGNNNHIYKEINVSRDMNKILTFIDLSYERWKIGFNDLEDIFEYVVTSKYFSSDSYNLKYFNVKKRLNERPDFNKFLDYINVKNINKNFTFNKNKEVYIKKIDDFFGSDISTKYSIHIEKQKKIEIMSNKFNGKIIMDITNLNGKKLGEFIGFYKKYHDVYFESFILNTTQEKINENINFIYQNFLLKS